MSSRPASQRHPAEPLLQRTALCSPPGWLLALLIAGAFLIPSSVAAQGTTGALIGTVKDPHGGALRGAVVRVSSPALISGTREVTTNDQGKYRFPSLPPGTYTVLVSLAGFASSRRDALSIGAGSTLDASTTLSIGGFEQAVEVLGAASRIDARESGFATRFGLEDIEAIPTRRASMFDFIRAAPGVSPTSPGSGTTTTVSAFGSGTNENQFLFDGTNFTCPCNGIARAEPGIDFIQEVQVHSVGASAEYGNVQGAVINVVTRQGGDRFSSDAAYYWQTSALTSQPVVLAITSPGVGHSGYERERYRDFTASIGGPALRDRLWFFSGYQHLRDYDSQPGSDPRFPRTYKQDKVFGKLTWKLTDRLQLIQSLHNESWVNPPSPTVARPFETTTRTSATVPAVTFGHLTHTLSDRTVWDVRAGRFLYAQEGPPSTGDLITASHLDRVTQIMRGGPPQFGTLTIARTTAKATLSHYRTGLLGADHQWKLGAQFERGDHRSTGIVPAGVSYSDEGALPFDATFRAPSLEGGRFNTAAAFASDAITVNDTWTINAGLRFDHTRAVSQDLAAIDSLGEETDGIVQGLGSLYTWNILSPRLGLTGRLTADGRTMLRASYGRFSPGVMTGELGHFHPGVTSTTTMRFDSNTGDYTTLVSTLDPRRNLELDLQTRAPRTDEYSVGIDRDVGRQVAVALAYVRKNGANFIGWVDRNAGYREMTRLLSDGRDISVFDLITPVRDRRFVLTNPDGYSLTYNGVVMVMEKRRAHGWHAFGSYTWSRAEGLQAASGGNAAAAQVSTVGPSGAITFGRDPNDLTNARGRLPNDRPHAFRLMASVDVPRTGVVVAANLQQFSGKPWAAVSQVALTQGSQRILLEPRGSRRLSSQSLLDLRVSRVIALRARARIELLLDVLNALNDSAEEALASDSIGADLKPSATFGDASVFMDPRRAMLGVKVNFGRQ
jgi:hypothetical protein